MMKIQPEKYFEIKPDFGSSIIQEVGTESIYNGKGWYRAAKVPNQIPEKPLQSVIYRDPNFTLNVSGVLDQNGSKIKKRRLYQIYDKELPLFSYKQGSTLFPDSNDYPIFIAESGLIDLSYLETMFFTKKVNKEGYYKYFIKRNGRYYVQTVDDEIPVHGHHQLPFWGLDLKYPWQIILVKAWIKEKNGIDNVYKSEPFEFLQAFGLPAYKACNFKKDLEFIEGEYISEQQKANKIKNHPSNKDKLIIIGKSRNVKKVGQLGLQKNSAAYLICPIQYENQIATIFKVESPLPCRWVGQLSLIADKNINNKYKYEKHQLNLQRSFLIKRKDLLEIFNKFYIAPRDKYINYPNLHINLTLDSAKSHQYIIKVIQGGKININIELPQNQKMLEQGKIRYPQIKYFLSKQTDSTHARRPPSKLQLKSRINIEQENYVQTEQDKYECYDIEFSHGYHKSINQFVNVEPGTYIIHVKMSKTQKNFQFNLSINTTAEIEPIILANFTQAQKNILFSSTFYSLALVHGVEVSFKQENHNNESILIGNLFYELGYGFICITTMKNATHHLAMRIFPKRLRQAGYQIKCGIRNKESTGIENPVVLVSQKGVPQILVLRMIKTVPLSQRFPPQNCVQFYRVK